MLTYIAGPILAFLPRRWRMAVGSSDIRWSRATALSGALEFVLGVVARGKWYFFSMNSWVSRGLAAALNGDTGPGVTDHVIGGMALLMWANHPLTWVLAYFSVEGAARFCSAAFGESYPGTLPLYLVDRIFAWIMGVPAEDPERPGVAASFIGALSDKMLEAAQPAGADEIAKRTRGARSCWKFGRAGRSRTGIHRGWCGLGSGSIGWRSIRRARRRGRSGTRCEGWQRG